ncbi:MAG TPA: type I methionyl aminopeptidase [bacterium]|nr:type I methionyl aminopeptidase [bacterium]HPN31690.1 type I methionyl aminopeptidase [bacterium]
MIIKSDIELAALKKIGRIVGLTLSEMISKLRPGITTAELDSIGRNFLVMNGAKPAPSSVYNFPAATCISVNDEAAHGIPGNRIIKQGDLVNIDVSAELNGYFADSGATTALEPVSKQASNLCRSSLTALNKCLSAAKSGSAINQMGLIVENEAKKYGFKTIQNLCGHGVGKSLHEEPHHILNYYDPKDKKKFKKGMVVAIECFVSSKATYVVDSQDGWTLKTPDNSLVAQYEHTIVITDDQPIILTKI